MVYPGAHINEYTAHGHRRWVRCRRRAGLRLGTLAARASFADGVAQTPAKQKLHRVGAQLGPSLGLW
jgi:hypothetical protein